MKNFKDRCLGVIVVYDHVRAPFAVARFKEIIAKSFSDYSVRIVTNNPAVDGGIHGSNGCGEFSGWAEGINHEDYEDYDIVLFANDTFSTKRPFSVEDENRFLQKIAIAKSRSDLFLIGELHWHISYRLLFKRKKFVLKWVRTNMFALSTKATKRIGGVSLAEREIASMVKIDRNGNFMLSQDILEVNRRRIEEWLNPVTPTLGWHGSQIATKSIKRLKAMCVLQELYLTKRCVEAGVPIYSSTSVRKRDYLLILLYNLQNRFL